MEKSAKFEIVAIAEDIATVIMERVSWGDYEATNIVVPGYVGSKGAHKDVIISFTIDDDIDGNKVEPSVTVDEKEFGALAQHINRCIEFKLSKMLAIHG